MNKAIEEAQATLKAAQEAAAEKVQETVALARINAKLSVANNSALQTAKAQQMLVTATTDRLKELELGCEAIVTEMPIISTKTRKERQWNPSRQYGMGNHIQLVSGLLSGIQYAAGEHKSQMLALTGLTEDLIEQTLEAFGSTAYYSKNYMEVVPGVDADLDTLVSLLSIVEDTLDVQLSKSKLTPAVMRTRFEVARLKAEKSMEEDAIAHELDSDSQQTIKVD